MANPYAPPTAAGIPVQPTFSDTTACAFAEPRQAVIHSLAACNVATAIFIPALIWQASAGYEPWALDAPLDKDPVFFRGAADVAVLSVGLLALLAYFTTVVLWAMWSVRANKNMRALRPDGHFTFTPGWTAGWFFVPIANLFKPYQAVKEMFVNSSTDGFSRMGVLGWWWGTWIIGNAVSSVSLFSSMADPVADPSSLVTGVDAATSALNIVTGILAIMVVRTINRNQVELLRRQA